MENISSEKQYKILLIAPYMPQVYVAIELASRLIARSENVDIRIATGKKYEKIIPKTLDCEILDYEILRSNQFSVSNASAVMIIGHSYFMKPELFVALSSLAFPIFWVNAHFERSDLSRWAADKRLAALITQTIHAVFYEEPDDRRALQNVGFEKKQLHYVQNAKYDCAAPSKDQIMRAEQMLTHLGKLNESIIVGGSVMAGPESAHIVGCFKSLTLEHTGLLLVLAPRSEDHIEEIEQDLIKNQISYALSSRVLSRKNDVSVLLVDEMGVLKGLYHFARIVVIGRSLFEKPGGGSNIIEPASQATALVVGPHMSGFESILRDLKRGNAVFQLATATDLCPVLQNLLKNPTTAREYGQRAKSVLARKSGGLSATAELIINELLSLSGRPGNGGMSGGRKLN